MDNTKFDLKISKLNNIESYQSLNIVETAFKIIEGFLDLSLESKDKINKHNFIGYQLLLNRDELNEKTLNVQERYKRTLRDHELFFRECGVKMN